MDELNSGTFVEPSSEPVASSPEPAPSPSESVSTPSSDTETGSPSPSPAPESPAQDPESPPANMEVISVTDLVDILTQAGEKTGIAEDPAEEEPASSEDSGGTEDTPVYTLSGGDTVTVEGMKEVLQRLETLEAATVHPMLETPFEDYTVTEGLLLLVFVILLLDFFLNLIRRWF